MTKRVVVNITASFSWRKQPVGIVRVERFLLQNLIKDSSIEKCYVILDFNTNSFRALSAKIVRKVFSDQWIDSSYEADLDKEVISESKKFEPLAGDTFLSIGSDWSFQIPRLVSELYNGEKVLVCACYDLIPLILPEFTPGSEFFEQFTVHYDAVARTAKRVFAISENSKRDLLSYWTSSNMANATLPEVNVLQLAGLTADELISNNNNESISPKIQALSSQRYVLYVSTIEPRKNHQLLVDIWRNFDSDKIQDCPILVFVGQQGWGSDDLIEQMHHMEVFKKGKVIWLDTVDDKTLSYLYRNCLFAVFPSFYEGWGLAATEALGFNKVCIVSNNSSLQEATFGTMPSLHPLDYLSWQQTIRKLFNDENYRKTLEFGINKTVASRSWSDFSRDFITQFLT